MLGTYFTFPELLIWLPLVAGMVAFFMKNAQAIKVWSLMAAVAVVAVSLTGLCYADASAYPTYNQVSYYWLKHLGNSFHLNLNKTGHLLSLLTALGFLFIFIYSWKEKRERSNSFYGLMLLAQAGIMGVFSAVDALVFYFFWELALIPVYFLCSMWGGEKRIQTTFKFFIYTFVGSLLMLTGILYVYYHTQGRIFNDGTQAMHSFALNAFQSANLSAAEQGCLFWLFLAAFGVKMPIFPLHTWQPGAYDQSPTPVTMVLSGIMVKMGLFGLLRWLLPVLPEASSKYADIVIALSIFGIIYASLIALVQDNLKKLVAYSSIAHIGLMSAAIFAKNELSLNGAILQMFNHGINIIGLWIIIGIIERKTGTKKISELGGLATKAPALTVFMIVIALANIALPLTNAFVGEFMMFSGLFEYSKWMTAIAGLGIILAAAYTLNMIRNVFYGAASVSVSEVSDIELHEKLVLSLIVLIVLATGVYPQPIIEFISNLSATTL